MNRRPPCLRIFDVMQSIMANVAFRFVHPISFPLIALLVPLAVVGQSIYKGIFIRYEDIQALYGPALQTCTSSTLCGQNTSPPHNLPSIGNMICSWCFKKSEKKRKRKKKVMLRLLMMVKGVLYVWRRTCSQSVILECFQPCITDMPTKAGSTLINPVGLGVSGSMQGCRQCRWHMEISHGIQSLP